MISSFILVVIVVIVALFFDFVNGFNDAANAIATIVVSKTLTPLQAVLFAGAANFIGYFTFGLAVATMIGKGVVHIDQATLPLLLAALLGAVEHAAKVRWITARKILWAWILTIPTAAIFAGISYMAIGPFLVSHTR